MASELTSKPARLVLEVLLRPYAQIVFSRDLHVGAVVLLAIAVFPRLALASLGAVLIAALGTWLFGLGTAAVREGTPACTAVLATLALAVFDPGGGHYAAIVVLIGVLSVVFHAASEALLAPVALPAHALPFVATAWTVHLAGRVLPPVPDPRAHLTDPLSFLPATWLEASFLDAPAAILFSHGALAGGLLLVAIALHSRIALLLAFLGWSVSAGIHSWLRHDAPLSMIDSTAAFNAILVAMAMGIWFVPQPSSMVLAAVASAIACVVTYALFPLTSTASLPVLALPFVLTIWLVLAATRRRAQDRHPRSAIPDTRPEETLARHLMWIRRFGDAMWLPFRLPFRGEWVVSQGHDGKHTHQGAWRHGLDFEGRTASGGAFDREGRELRDYACYGLPVLASGTGTVVHVIDGVPDNKPGQVNTRDNWGNTVVVAHGLGLHSVYSHLQLRSIRLKPGDAVAAGAEIGRCGNSGRSPTPHLHFQVQRGATLGSPTIPADFGDVVMRSESGYDLSTRMIPKEGSLVRPVMRDEALAGALAFTPGSEFELVEEGTGRKERAKVEVDLLGRRTLTTARARLHVDPYDAALVFIDFRGDPKSLLRYLLIGMARVPFDQASLLRWKDGLPRRLLLPSWIRAAADLVSVVVPAVGGIEVAYTGDRAEGNLRIEGTAKTWSTRTILSLGEGSHRFEIVHGKRKSAMVMTKLEAVEEARA